MVDDHASNMPYGEDPGLRPYSGRGLVSQGPKPQEGLQFRVWEGDANGNNKALVVIPDIPDMAPD